MKFLDTDSLFTIVASADEEGYVHIRWLQGEKIQTYAQVRELLECIFLKQPLLTLRVSQVKKAISELDVRIAESDSHTIISFSLTKLLLLPAVRPAAELAEFRALLVAMKDFFMAHPTEKVDIQLCNERDNNRRVYGSIACRTRCSFSETKMTLDREATKVLEARIEASTVLSHWLRHVALNLQKLGPWSWSVISEDELFGWGQGPYYEYFRAEREKNPPKPDTACYIELNIE